MLLIIGIVCIGLLTANLVVLVGGAYAVGRLFLQGYRVSVWREEESPSKPYG